MSTKPMHEWFHKHITPAFFGPGLSEASRPMHLKIRDSLRDMVQDMELIENEGNWLCAVKYLEYKYFLSMSVNESSSRYASDYKPSEDNVEDQITFLRKLMQERLRVVEICLHRDWAEFIFAHDGKRYRIKLLMLYTPPKKQELYKKLA